jgi:hypothetical protein
MAHAEHWLIVDRLMTLNQTQSLLIVGQDDMIKSWRTGKVESWPISRYLPSIRLE